ncbi:MAG TPA: DUF362 domain-containing protein, partial [Desulfomonilaceae bacterium]|nr:DUF362 domain-containing protein [Desulfomonilaceae bacterium]
LLMSSPPEKAVVTHPAFVEAVASQVLDAGGCVFLGDSPPLGNLNRVLSKSGYGPFMNRLGVKPVPFVEKQPLDCSDGRLFRRIDLAREIFDFDFVINLPKLKTHTQMMLTLAVKNLFGSVIGTDKASWHLRAGKDFDTFATILVQIYEKVHPALSIIDGILGMEGNGPNNGTPRHVGIVGASRDAVALDAVLCKLVGFDIEHVRTCVMAREMGIGTAEWDGIQVTGDALDGFPLKDFLPPKSATIAWNMSPTNPLRRFLQNHLITKPDIDARSCQNCGVCLEHCPPRAIREVDGVMTIDRSRCISCFCCHELCAHNAVRIVQPLFGRFMSRIST